MDKLKMQSLDVVGSNIQKIAQLFPNCVTERLGKDGKPELAIDFEKLQAELSNDILSENEERYQFTWPDKRAANRLANTPTTMTLLPCREESVDFDNTENLYIEGDNLDVLKVLRETYLGKVKMIYIDPPYNTGNDFVYNDDFAQSKGEFEETSGLFDGEGNLTVDPMQRNMESNGRFHTDWLNMIYPRLKVARDLLSEDGAIFVHIDEHEVYSLSLVLRELFGSGNELGTIIWDKRNPKGAVAGVAYQHESVLIYCKNINSFSRIKFSKKKEHAKIMLEKVESLINSYGGVTNEVRTEYKRWIKENQNSLSGGEKAYNLIDDNGLIYQAVSMAAPDKPETRSHRALIHPRTHKACPIPEKGWRFTDKKMDELLNANRIEFGSTERSQPRQKYFLLENMDESVSSLLYHGGYDDAMGMPFDNPKPIYVAKKIIDTICKNKNEIILDFFSGSATAAHAVMQLNTEDEGNRKFIMVQLPEETNKKSEAYKAGYKNICEIGKERIRRAGKKIKEESPLTTQDLDTGFRVLKLASSNMQDVYYTPQEFDMHSLFNENVKTGRTNEDLLFQVMLDLGIELSAKIENRQMDGKTVHFVDGNYLIACFDENVSEDMITEIAQMHPVYFVMRDASAANDNVIDNFEQIFKAYSEDTVRKIL